MSSVGVSVLHPYPNLLLKQTRKGCLRNILGCDSRTEIKVATIESPKNDVFYAVEESECCIRTFCPRHHPFKMHLTHGAEAGGPNIATYDRPLGCELHPCKCCCFQSMEAFDSQTNSSIGKTIEAFYFCIVTFKVERAVRI